MQKFNRELMAFEKLQLLLAGLTLVVSAIALLAGILAKRGVVVPDLWQTLFGQRPMPQDLGDTLLKWGLIGLAVSVLWNIVTRVVMR